MGSKMNGAVDSQRTQQMVRSAIRRCRDHMIMMQYRGYDPYDTLQSPLFRLPVLDRPLVKFAAQQLGRRIPFNFRRLLGIRKGLNPVTIGLSIQAYSYLSQVLPGDAAFLTSEIDKLYGMLMAVRSRGYSGLCWGYDFDWEARYTRIPAYMPTSVATGIITNALYESYSVRGDQRALQLCRDAVDFIRKDIRKSHDETGFCYSYSPGDSQFVLNASMKGARLLAQVYSVDKDTALRSEAEQAVHYVVDSQNPDGSWPYARHDPRTWTDNYHTGYILDCLDSYIRCTGDQSCNEALEKGIQYYINHFFDKGCIPKFYKDSRYPVDSTAAAQSLLSLSRFNKTEQAMRVAAWCIRHMQASNGGFYYRMHRTYTDRTIFMRWSNAWMLVGLSYMLYRHMTSLASGPDSDINK